MADEHGETKKGFRGERYLRDALSVALGAGALLGGSYLVSRIKEKHDTEASLSRLEQMLDELSGTGTRKGPEGAASE